MNLGVIVSGLKKLTVPIIILAMLGGTLLFIHQYGDRHYKNGYQAGYAQCIKDNPTTVVQGGVVNQNVIVKEKRSLLDLVFWRIGRLQLGLPN